MSRQPATGRDNLTGSLFMILSMAGFTVEDSFIKMASLTNRSISTGQFIVIVGITGTIFFGAIAAMSGQPLLPREMRSKPLLLRGFFEILGRLAYTLSFVFAPLITATAILQAAPLVVVAGAAIFLGEKTGPRQWLAVFLGFFGVMLILEPWGSEFGIMAILAVLGMIGFAGRDLATRAAPAKLSNWQLGFIGYAMFTIAGLLIWFMQSGATGLPVTQLTPWATLLVSVATIGGITGYYALTRAMRQGDIGVVTPWRYTRLIFSAILALWIFGEPFSTTTLIGSAIVVGSGIFTLTRKRR